MSFQDDMGSIVRDPQEKQSHVWLRHVVVPMLRRILDFVLNLCCLQGLHE